MLEKSELMSALAPILVNHKKKRRIVEIRYTGKALDSFFKDMLKTYGDSEAPPSVSRITRPQDKNQSSFWVTSQINWADDIIYVNDLSSRHCTNFVEFAYRAMMAGRLKGEYSDMVVVDVLNSIKKELPEFASYEINNSDE